MELAWVSKFKFAVDKLMNKLKIKYIFPQILNLLFGAAGIEKADLICIGYIRTMLANTIKKCSVRFMSVYAQRMREAWARDPSLVHPDWDQYFRNNKTQHPIPTSPDSVISEEDLRGK